MGFSLRERSQALQSMARNKFDLAVIGGGINGAGIARDAASRGMKVALVEAKDFAIGTSSRSSKLIHGGLRYLEQLKFHLVFEALSERSILSSIAPHLVHPLRFLIPVYRNSRVGYAKMSLGLWLYDFLSLFQNSNFHEGLKANKALERVPLLEACNLLGAFEYSDAYTEDDRLVIETLRDAQRLGAQVAHYTQVVGVQRQGDRVEGLEVKDHLSGSCFLLKSKQFIGALGPWTDQVGCQLATHWKPRLRTTKGVHLTFHRTRIPIDRAVVMTVEKRIVFAIPRPDMVLVGTTDTDFHGDPYKVSVERQDMDYILRVLNSYFPALFLEAGDVLASYSGVRPLLRDGASNASQTSREHSLFHEGPNLSFIAGGKYTTYRKMSQEAVDFVIKKMPFSHRMVFSPSKTKALLNPYVSWDKMLRLESQTYDLSKEFGVSLQTVEFLIRRHGEEALEILNFIKAYLRDSKNRVFDKKRSMDSGLENSQEVSMREVEALWMGEAQFSINEEMCLSLSDFYWRRSSLFLSQQDHGLAFLEGLAQVFAQNQNWSPDRAEEEKRKLKKEIIKS